MMSSPTSATEDTIDNATAIPLDVPAKQTKEWVKFEDETPVASSTPKKISITDQREKKSDTDVPALIKPESVTIDVSKINKSLDTVGTAEISDAKKADNTYNAGAAVIAANSVQINLDRSGLGRSVISDNNAEPNHHQLQPNSAVGVFNPKSASLKTIDLRDASNGRNVISTPIGNIRQGFANGDTIVTLLPVNTKWPWITPARFRPELVPEELMAQGLTVSISA